MKNFKMSKTYLYKESGFQQQFEGIKAKSHLLLHNTEGKFNMHFLGKIFVQNWMTKVQNEMMKQVFQRTYVSPVGSQVVILSHNDEWLTHKWADGQMTEE